MSTCLITFFYTRLFGCYRDIGATIYPVIPDMNDFQTNLDVFLRSRANGVQAPTDGSEAVDRPFGMKISFIGLLFAVLAAGCTNSDMPGKERELTSQVYGTH